MKLLLRQMVNLWNKIWRKLDGNKTLIGLVLINVDSRLFAETDALWNDIALTIVYTWTGIGAGHKVRKILNGKNFPRGEKYIRKISDLRKSVNLFRNKR